VSPHRRSPPPCGQATFTGTGGTIRGAGTTTFAQSISTASAPACDCGLRSVAVFGLTVPTSLYDWAVALKHGTASVMLLARRTCARSTLDGDYVFADSAALTVADVCVPGQVVPSGTYRPATGTISGTLGCATSTDTNSGE
jgi:hypothetical protein